MNRLCSLSFFAVILCSVFNASPIAATGLVKKSSSGICHDSNSPYYGRTKNFTPFDDLSSCLDSGGRLPGGKSVQTAKSQQPANSAYERSLFGSWADEDGDCLNTRHELLAERSEESVTYETRCRVGSGEWIDPYTGRVFTDPDELDIDHVVPLRWAWENGADEWSRQKRVAFANDPDNLLIVEDGINSQKGAQGMACWLPPEESYHDDYRDRWELVLKRYEL